MSVYEGLSESQQFACRVIADHARATAFAIADGILPGNEGRNYVLRKIMRRAIYHGREHLGLKEPFFYKVCDFVVDEMSGAFSELETQRYYIVKIVMKEEEKFGNALTKGMEKFDELTRETLIEKFSRIISSDFKQRISSGELQTQTEDNRKKVSEKIDEMTSEHLDTWGSIDDYDMWALNTLNNRIPPTMFMRYLESLDRPYFVFQPRFFADALYDQICKRKIPEEIEIEGRVRYDPDRLKRIFEELDKLFLETLGDLDMETYAKLFDTYGYPPDLIRVGLEEYGIRIPESEFNDNFDMALQEIQKQSGIGQTERKAQISPVYSEILEVISPNKFHGYETTQLDGATVAAILDGDKRIDSLNEGQQGSVILNETPFYAESGGQVGDTGILVCALPPADAGGSDLRVAVADTYSPVAGLIIHKVTVEKGSVKVGDKVSAVVDADKRDATRRNHTATHLVHAALKEVLGTHVKQAGSVVAPSYLRFDFTHYQPMNAAEIQEVEDLVNRYILQNEPVTTNMMAIEEAMRSGAVAMFGEKYGAEVRVLSVGDGAFSKELCGGTHVRATGDIGSFKITSDEAIASGVRRIRAITGFDALTRFREDELLIDRSLSALKTQRDNLPNAIEKLQEEVKRTRKEIDELKLKIATGTIGEASSNGDEGRDVAGIKVLGKIVDGLDANGTRQLSDTLLARLKSGVVVLGRRDDGKVSIIVRVSDDLTDKVKAGNVIKEIIPIVGGRGGGKADMAEGGGNEPEKLGEAIDASYKVIETFITG